MKLEPGQYRADRGGGQRSYGTPKELWGFRLPVPHRGAETTAIGEGFGDYLAASFFADKKKPAYRKLVMSWAGLPWVEEWWDTPRPFLRRLDEPVTFADFKNRQQYEHINGRIWSATLWDVRTALGRDVADRIIVDSHFELDGYTRMVRGARAILDADRNLYGGVHEKKLRKAFEKRGFDLEGH